MTSHVARLKAQIDAKKVNPLDQHHQKVRSQAERERIQVETAKKMASRFNLTFRALALQAAKKAADERKRDMEAARQAKEAAAKFQMTARALKMSSTGTAKGKVDVLNAPATPKVKVAASAPAPAPKLTTLEDLAKEQQKASDSIAVAAPPPVAHDPEELEMLRATRPSTSDGREEEDAVTELRKEEDDASVIVNDANFDTLSRITEVTREQDHEEHDAFRMPTLATALQSGDDNAINVAVVRSFLEEHDPSRINEAAELVAAHKGREEQLMEALNEQYPPVNDVKDLIEEPTEEALKQEEAARPSSTRGRPVSTRVKGLTLSVKMGEGLAVPTLEASVQADGESGYILSGVKQDRKSTKFVVNPSSGESEQARILRERMAQKGYDAQVIEAVVGEASEML